MREYKKPIIEEENLELEDIIAASGDGETTDGKSLNPFSFWTEE